MINQEKKNRKVVRFLNRLFIIETVIGLVVLLIIYLFFYGKLT